MASGKRVPQWLVTKYEIKHNPFRRRGIDGEINSPDHPKRAPRDHSYSCLFKCPVHLIKGSWSTVRKHVVEEHRI